MTRLVRTLSLLVAAALVLSACGLIPLPEPVELDTAFGFGDGIEIDLTASGVAEGAIAPSAVATEFSGGFNETFEVEEAEIPAILKTLVRIKSVSETITLGTTITVTNPVETEEFPATFSVSDASIADLEVYRGTSKLLGPLAFSGIAGASIEFTSVGDCSSAVSCTYEADILVDLLELQVSGSTASNLAKAIADGGTFRVEGTFAIVVDPGLPVDATVSAVIVGTGAIVE